MADACTMLRDLAGAKYGDRTKAMISKSAKASGLEFFRARAIWYGYARRIEQHEYEQIKAAWLRNRIKVAENGLHELEATISRLKALLRATDEDFHSPTIDALGGVRGRVG